MVSLKSVGREYLDLVTLRAVVETQPSLNPSPRSKQKWHAAGAHQWCYAGSFAVAPYCRA